MSYLTDSERRSRPTMREVAALAGVSLKTVSRVINAEPNVSPDLADKVRSAIGTLDYRQNMTASSLRRSDGKTSTIGVLLENVGNPFSSTLHRAIEDVARARGVAVFAGSLDEDQFRERELVRAFAARQVDGLIIAPASFDHRYLENERRGGTEIVFIDRGPVSFEADSVLTDNRWGALVGVQHLVRVGHRRISFLGDLRTIATARDRFAGYVDAMEGAGLVVEDALIRHDLHTPLDAQIALTSLLHQPNPPTAIFTSQNLITIGAVRALHEQRLHHSVALVGFDDIALSDLLEPGVTVVAQQPYEIGQLAANALFRRLDSPGAAFESTLLRPELMARGSGEIPALN
jgi:LacI family transcriptional regulator